MDRNGMVELTYPMGTASMHVTELSVPFLAYRCRITVCCARKPAFKRCRWCREALACRAELRRRISLATSIEDLKVWAPYCFDNESTMALVNKGLSLTKAVA